MARPAEEMLYVAMEDFRVDVVVGKGPGATAIPLDVAPFTLVGRHHPGRLLPGPLRDRFGFTAHLDFYDADELEQVLRRTPRCSASSSSPTAPRRSADAPAARPGSPTGCCAGSVTSPRCAPTAWSRARWLGPRWRSMRSTSSVSTGSTGPC